MAQKIIAKQASSSAPASAVAPSRAKVAATAGVASKTSTGAAVAHPVVAVTTVLGSLVVHPVVGARVFHSPVGKPVRHDVPGAPLYGMPEPLISRKSSSKPCCDDCGKAEALGKPKPCGGPRAESPKGVRPTVPGPRGRAYYAEQARLRESHLRPASMSPGTRTPLLWTGDFRPGVICRDGMGPRKVPFTSNQIQFFREIYRQVPNYIEMTIPLPCAETVGTAVCSNDTARPYLETLGQICNHKEGMLRAGQAWPHIFRHDALSSGRVFELFLPFEVPYQLDEDIISQIVFDLGKTAMIPIRDLDSSLQCGLPWLTGETAPRPDLDFSIGYWTCGAAPAELSPGGRIASPPPTLGPVSGLGGTPGSPPPPPAGAVLCSPPQDLRLDADIATALVFADGQLQLWLDGLAAMYARAWDLVGCWFGATVPLGTPPPTLAEIRGWVGAVRAVLASPPPIYLIEQDCQFSLLSGLSVPDSIVGDAFLHYLNPLYGGWSSPGCCSFVFGESADLRATGWWAEDESLSPLRLPRWGTRFEYYLRERVTVVLHELTHQALPPVFRWGGVPLSHAALFALWGAVSQYLDWGLDTNSMANAIAYLTGTLPVCRP